MHLDLAILDSGFRYMVAVEGVKLPCTVLQNLTFSNFHHPAAVVLQLLHKEDNGKRLRHQVIQSLVAHVVFLSTQRHHAVVGGLAAIGVGSGNNRVAGAGRLLRRKRFRRLHLAHAHHIRVTGQGKLQKPLLIVVLLGVIGKAGDGVDYIVEDIPFGVLLHQIKLPASIFNSKNSLFIGNGGENPTHQRGLAAAGGAGDANRQAEPQHRRQKIQHFGGSRSIADKIIPPQLFGVYDSDGGRHALVLVGQRIAQNRNTDFIGEMAHHSRLAVVQDHPGFMKQPADHIHGVLGALEALLGGDHTPIRIGDLGVLPGVDVDLLHIAGKQVRRQEGELGHFRIELVNQGLVIHAFHTQAVIIEILGDVGGDLLALFLRVVGYQGRILAGKILLHLCQHLRE